MVDYFWMSQHAVLYDINGNIIESIDLPHLVNGFEYEIQAAIDAITHGLKETKEMTWNDTLSIMSYMDHIRAHAGLVYPSELD